MEIKNGHKAKCVVTGFEGTVIAITDHLTGCDTLCLKPPVDKDGKIQDGQWFDRNQLEYIGKGVKLVSVKPNKKASKDRGGPHPEAQQL